MFRYRAVISYDGTSYFGWQAQDGLRTVEGALRDSFDYTFKLPLSILSASRTDAGVHALGQVVRITTPLDLDPQRILHAWNAHVPRDILIRSLERADDFHPRRNVVSKTYYYHVSCERLIPMLGRYVAYHNRNIDISKLQAALQIFVGSHDFRSFCTGNDHEETVKRIDNITVRYLKRYNVYQIAVVGPAFLRYMVRRIVGASLLVASSSLPLEILTETLGRKNPEHTLPTAPAHGLMLRKIVYALN